MKINSNMKIPKLVEEWTDIPAINEKTLGEHSIEDELLKRMCDLIFTEVQCIKDELTHVSKYNTSESVKYKEELLKVLTSVFKPLNVQAEMLGNGGEIVSVEDWIVKPEDMIDMPKDTENCTLGGYLEGHYDEFGNLEYYDLTSKNPFKIESDQEDK